MGRQRSNSLAAGGGSGSSGISSIALLQERFRQLQKMKDKRQEFELLKLFPAGSETANQYSGYEPNPSVSSLEHREITTRPCFQDSVTLGLNLYTKQAEAQKPAKQPLFVDFWSVDSTSVSTIRAHDHKTEVDTSLHL
ncbi:uncharacterized protein [Rutidosis leptorrhynchoides]|uniref:uncharacterized protein n=1 Tax=Rutidosis leptorrhynchoides TaxID=125765 RepID=UPI003A999A72